MGTFYQVSVYGRGSLSSFPAPGTISCLPGGALTLISARQLQRSNDPTTPIGIVTLDANSIKHLNTASSCTRPGRVAERTS